MRAQTSKHATTPERAAAGATIDLSAHVTRITNLLKTRGGLGEARQVFTTAATRWPHAIPDLVQALGDATEPAPETITLGEGTLVFGNPTRVGFAWRCGTCQHAWRTGAGRPAVGVNYKTLRGARNAAGKHNSDEHAGGTTIHEVAWCEPDNPSNEVTLDQPCFELLYANGEPVDTGDYIPHFTSRAAAIEEAARYTIAEDGLGTPVPHQRATPCAPGVDCAVCGPDEDDYVTHFESPEQALRHVRDSGWKVNDDGTAVCPDCGLNLP